VGDLLDEVRTLASDFALERLGRELGLVDTPTRVYVLWRWAYGGEELEFDEANKLSKSLGAELDELERTHGLVLGRGQTVALPDFRARLAHKVLSRPIQRILESGEWSRLSLIDALHLALWYWRRGERDKVAHLLALCGFEDENHRFWQVAQALYEVEREEKSLSEESLALGQMLPSQRTLIQEAEVRSAQQSQLRLFDEEEE
jgi:hypothetical protein